MPADITTSWIYAFILVFSRLGTGIMLMPGVGEGYVSPKIKVFFAFTFTIILVPILKPSLPEIPTHPIAIVSDIALEIMVGLLIGSAVRILIGALNIAGTIIAFQSGLAAASMFDATQNIQSSIISNFFSLVMVTLFFVTNLHHLMLRGLIDSYHIFTPSSYEFVSDAAAYITDLVADSFLMAVKIASPQIVIGLLLYLGSGVLARLMPNMQIFFILIPLQILISFFILMITFSAAMLWYVDEMGLMLSHFLTLE